MDFDSPLAQTMYSFYDHNWQLVFFGGMSILALFLGFLRPSRFYTLVFLAFFILTLNFEYDKHLFSKIKTDMLDLIFPQEMRFRKYSLIRNFLEFYLPILLNFLGWGLLALSLLFYGPKSKSKE